ncbi:MAG: phage baseplate assembly protein V [Acidobacteriota bacterium]
MRIDASRPDGDAPRYFGVYPAIVTDITKDGNRLGRIELKFPWLGDEGRDVRALATLCTPYADDDQGFEMIPAVDSQVIVGFEAGQLTRPYILGACWNGRERLPQDPEQANNKRLIKSRSGSLLEFDDTEGAAKVTVSMQSGHVVVLDDGAQEVRVQHANGSLVKINAAGQITVTANATVEINASAVNVHAGSAIFDGLVQCQTLITNSVVSSSYTPGAGNVW